MKKSNSAGFSLLEVLITAVVGGIIVAAASTLIYNTLAVQERAFVDQATNNELAELLAMVENEWRVRIQPENASFVLDVSSGFSGTASPCKDLTVTQRNAATQLPQTISFRTTCVSTSSGGEILPAHTESSCGANQLAQVVVSRANSPNLTFPTSGGRRGPLSMALCFRPEITGTTGHIALEAGAFAINGRVGRVISKRKILTVGGRNLGIEFIK